MRTTLSINDALLKQAKRASLERNCTLGEVVEDALRVAFASKKSPQKADTIEPFKTFQGDGLHPGIDLNDSRALNKQNFL